MKTMNYPWESGVRRVVPYVPGEQPKNTDVIKLNTNENPYPPAPEVREILDSFDVSRMRLYPTRRCSRRLSPSAMESTRRRCSSE